jgi:histidyl-tRNA synthetase
MRKIAQTFLQHGYVHTETPLVERRSVFEKQLGSGSEVMRKEVFSIGDDALLRVEGTAGVAGAYAHLDKELTIPAKLWYAGSIFRKEQPQMGRYRQFEQIGVEFIQAKKQPYDDLHVIETLWTILQHLEIQYPLTVNRSSRTYA